MRKGRKGQKMGRHIDEESQLHRTEWIGGRALSADDGPTQFCKGAGGEVGKKLDRGNGN